MEALIGLIEETDDRGLFFARRERGVDNLEMLWPKAPHVRGNPVRPTLGFLRELRRSIKSMEIARITLTARAHDNIRRANNATIAGNTDSTLPRSHFVVGDVARAYELVGRTVLIRTIFL